MPELRDTELRVLLVLLRATVGWNRDGRQLPMRYRDLMLRTGRRSEAVAKALSSLREKGLIHVAGKLPSRIPKTRASEIRRQQTKTERV